MDPRTQTGRVVTTAFLAAVLLKVFVIDFMIAEGRSMQPIIKPGTVLIINKAAYGIRKPFVGGYILRWATPRAGELVVFTSPDGRSAVKRCASGPGDALGDTASFSTFAGYKSDDLVPPGNFIAIGENRPESWDSRNYGFVPVNVTIGKVIGLK